MFGRPSFGGPVALFPRPLTRRPMRALRILVVLFAFATSLLFAVAPASAATGTSVASDGQPHTVTFDGYSFLVDGQRTYLWSGEFHYFRLPSPSLWLDIFHKMKAAGFNATSLYFDWGY